MRIFLFLLVISFSLCSLKEEIKPDVISNKEKTIIKGLSLVAPPAEFRKDPMPDVTAVNAEWIAVIPYAGSYLTDKEILFDVEGQWWGETSKGIKETIRLARKANLKIMMKPQIWVPGSWPGGIEFEKESDWLLWEASYRKYIMHYVGLCQEMDVELICIGTEFKKMEVRREKFWRELIRDIRKEYDGKLTYAANWDCYDILPFWDDLDYIGVDAYFPLDESKTPNKETLMKKWKPVHKKLSAVYNKFNKPILFTEFGYLSVDGCAGKTWELEKVARKLPSNEKAQSIALEALFDFFDDQPYWEGGFLWKWYPELGVHQDHGNNGHTPQGKLAEETVREWYGEM